MTKLQNQQKCFPLIFHTQPALSLEPRKFNGILHMKYKKNVSEAIKKTEIVSTDPLAPLVPGEVSDLFQLF